MLYIIEKNVRRFDDKNHSFKIDKGKNAIDDEEIEDKKSNPLKKAKSSFINKK